MPEVGSRDEIQITEDALREIEFGEALNKIKKKCISEPGKEIILALKPSQEAFWLRREHELIGEMTSLLIEEREVPLENVSDVREKIRKSLVEGAVLNSTDLLEVRDNIRTSRLLRKFFTERKDKYPALAEETANLHHNLILEKHIADAIDDTGEVKNNASRELARIRRSIFDKSNKLRARLDKILKQVVEDDYAQEDFFSLREGRFVLPVKAEHKRHISGIIHGVSQTGQTVFLEPSEIIEMNNELSLLRNEENREIYRILSNLTGELGDEAHQFLTTVDIIGHLDSIIARARYALDFGGIQPEILESKEIFLKDIRHPLLVHAKGKEKVVPLSIEFDEKKRGHLVSGPNAGGKTVALKSIGLNVAMALSGIFPLGECKTGYRTIFSSIGDHQSIEHDLSTFSSQIVQIRDILQNCTPEALILIDEIGSGTDPEEGSALAAGIMDTLINLNVFFVATTHQSSLKTYALNREEIENASLEFDEEKLTPTYKFLSGLPGNSYAFILAETYGLSPLVLERAKNYLSRKQKELEESISIMQRYRREAENLRQDAEKEKSQAEKTRQKYETKFDDIKKKRSEYIDQAKKEASDIVSNANALIENTIREIREEKKPVSDIKKDFSRKKEDLSQKASEVYKKEEEAEEEPVEQGELAVGDNVSIEDSSSVGTIIDIDRKNDKARVDVNGMKFTMDLDKLTRKKKEKSKKKQSFADYIKYDTKSSIDLRGMRADEAIRELEDYLSDAVMSNNLDQVSIIHGKGTGTLRQAVHDFLKDHHAIRSYRLGAIEEGGSGVTIVEL